MPRTTAPAAAAPNAPEMAFFTLDETHRILRVSCRTLTTILNAGALWSIRLRGRRLVPKASLDALIAKSTVHAKA